MDVSIIIVNYKTADLIIDCIKSVLYHTTGIEYEIIVVDNASNDSFEQRISFVFSGEKNIRYLPLDDNYGFGIANNRGVEIAKGRNVFFLNPDTILLNNAIKILSDFIDENPEVGACGANLYNAEMKETISAEGFFPSISRVLLSTLFGRIFREKANKYKYNKNSFPLEVAYVSGADLMIQKKVFDDMEGFSPEFFMYYEETDLCYRIKKKGYKIKLLSQAKIQHLEGGSFTEKGIKTHKIKMMEKSRMIFYRRHYSSFYTKISNAIYLFDLYIRLFMYKLRNDRNLHLYTQTKIQSFHEVNFKVK